MIMEAKKLPLLIALITVIGTLTAFVPQQAFSGPPGFCGDGFVDIFLGEACDPPDGITCDDFCQVPPLSCGDGVVDIFLGEACDPPDGITCDNFCQIIPPFCGDGNVDPGEQCEPPDTATCDALCQNRAPLCGDLFVTPPETCDDGNIIGGDGCSATCQLEVCDNSVVDPGEQCDPPDGITCDDFCQLILAPDGTVIGSTSVPQFCGAKQLTVTSPADFTPVQEAINYGEVINLQVSPERTLRIANTGGGAAVVTTDLTLVDLDGETTLWQDLLLNDVFDRCSTRSSSTSPSSYATMNRICDPPFIEILPAQTDPESTFVDRFLRVRPDVPDTEFAGPPVRDVITYTQILRLEVSCDPVATCPPLQFESNGACVIE